MATRRDGVLIGLSVVAFAGCAAVMAAQISLTDGPASPPAGKAPLPPLYEAAAGNLIVASASIADLFNNR